ncbi:glycosyltransferase family 4 protein [Candidatus Omnitrophota bacterium]
MKVLFIAPRMPLPADTGGKIRTFNIIKQLAKNNDVTLACFSFNDGDHFFLKDFKALNIKVKLVSKKENNFFQKCWYVFMNILPYSAAKYYCPLMFKAIEGLLVDEPFDLIHVDHVHMAHYVSSFKGIPCLVDQHNVEYRILERCASVERMIIKKIIYKAQAKKMKRYESKMLRYFSAASAVSKDDAQILVELLDAAIPIHVLPNGVDTGYFKWPIIEQINGDADSLIEENAVVFTGSMDWLPNDDSALYFCKKILPLIWCLDNKVKFYIVGKNPSHQLIEYAKKDKRIELTGRVDDVRVYVAKSKVFVVPLRIGGGTRLKILESLSMKKPVVSTTIGAEGIDYTQDENIVLADIPEIFAEKVFSLLKDEARRRLLGEAGRKLVKEKYDWSIVGEKLESIYQGIKNEK